MPTARPLNSRLLLHHIAVSGRRLCSRFRTFPPVQRCKHWRSFSVSSYNSIKFLDYLYDYAFQLSTASFYILPIRNYHLRRGWRSPLSHTVPMALRGFKRLARSTKNIRLPYLTEHHAPPQKPPSHLDLFPCDQFLTWYAYTFAFCDFLRISEFVPRQQSKI